MFWRKREFTQFDYDLNATECSLRFNPRGWTSEWPDAMTNGTENLHIWLGHHTCGFYFQRADRRYGPYSWFLSFFVPWRFRLFMLATKTMNLPHVRKHGARWELYQQLQWMTTKFDGPEGLGDTPP